MFVYNHQNIRILWNHLFSISQIFVVEKWRGRGVAEK